MYSKYCTLIAYRSMDMCIDNDRLSCSAPFNSMEGRLIIYRLHGRVVQIEPKDSQGPQDDPNGARSHDPTASRLLLALIQVATLLLLRT